MGRALIILGGIALLGVGAVPVKTAELAGGLLEWPRTSTETVRLANPGFEAEGQGWLPARPEAFHIASQPGLAHSGKGCVRFNGDQATRFVPSLRQGLDLGPGVYVLRFWLKTLELGAKGKGNDGARVQVDYQRQDGQRAWPATEVFRGTRDWQARELRILIPPDVKSNTVFLTIARYGAANGGEALFDDFSLERVVPPPVEAFLQYPNYRGLLPENGPGHVRLWVKVNAVKPAQPAHLLVEEEKSGKTVARLEVPAGKEEAVMEIAAADWPLGNYLVRAKMGEAAYPAYRVRKISGVQQQQMALWFDPNGVLHHHGQPVFVLGFYNAGGWDVKERLDQLAEARPNLAIDYMSWALPLVDQRQYLAQLQERGVSFFHTVNMVYPGSAYNVFRHPIGKDLAPDVRETEDTPENIEFTLRDGRKFTRKLAPDAADWFAVDVNSGK